MLHERAIQGVQAALETLKARGKQVLAVTNNSSLGRHAVAERFRRYGLPLADHEVFAALTATAQYVAHHYPGARVHAFGNPGLWGELRAFGVDATDDETDVACVVVGNHHTVTYDAIARAMRALLNGADLVAVNADRHYRGADDKLIPGVGAWVGALEGATGKRPTAIVGKPSTTILLEAAASVGVQPGDCVYVGDNAEVDVVGAHAAGMDALLVYTGVSRADEAHADPPDHVLLSVADLRALFSGGPAAT